MSESRVIVPRDFRVVVVVQNFRQRDVKGIKVVVVGVSWSSGARSRRMTITWMELLSLKSSAVLTKVETGLQESNIDRL